MKTKEEIESKIKYEDYKKIGEKTTLCLLTLENGFEIVGTSACVDPSLYDSVVGGVYAREKAISKLWELEGYLDQNKMIGG